MEPSILQIPPKLLGSVSPKAFEGINSLRRKAILNSASPRPSKYETHAGANLLIWSASKHTPEGY